MEINRCVKQSFSVIGKEGSTDEGRGFIQKLWKEANGHFQEIEHLAKREKNGTIVGIWGVMTDLSRTFQPWQENYTTGLYLAGIEVEEEAQAPDGWVKWTVPGYEYLCVKCTEDDVFSKVIAYMQEQGLQLAGAVHDFFSPQERGQEFLFFPIKRL